MNVMDITSFPALEALVFDYVSFGFFNLWTCLAVLTATVTFWKFRSSAGGAGCDVASSPPQSTTLSAVNKLERDTTSSSSSESTSSIRSLKKNLIKYNYDRFEYDGVTKGKFVAHYEEEDEGRSDVHGGDGGSGDGEVTVTEWWGSWERVRKGEMGWYRYQDLTVINGNVVRLWDDVKRRRTYVKQIKIAELSLNCCCLVD